ncbi:hypothetical protein D3C71_1584120 [compost metagenome]
MALERDRRHAAAIWDAAGLHGSAPWRATGLCIEREEGHPLFRKPVDIGGGHSTSDTATVGAEVPVARVVRYDQNDVWFARFLRYRGCRENRCGYKKRSSTRRKCSFGRHLQLSAER